MKRVISAEQFAGVVSGLHGVPISRTWRGIGTAIFVELGKLSNAQRPKGEATIMLEWSWRVEAPKSIAFGSFSGDRKISNRLAKLVGLKVAEIGIVGRLPELFIRLSNGYYIQSFSTVEGDPEWCLLFRDGSAYYSQRQLLIEETNQ